MVTQIYTAPISAVMPNKAKAKQDSEAEDATSEQSKKDKQKNGAEFDRNATAEEKANHAAAQPVMVKPRSNITVVHEPSTQTSTKLEAHQLATVQEYTSKRSINITSIITDMMGTAASVGAPTELIQGMVIPYLQSVAAEATKPKPSAKFIKLALQQTAVALDDYISDALRQPSTVVSEWVDALLMQEVDFKADRPIELSIEDVAVDPARSLEYAIQSATTHQTPLNPDEKADVRTMMKQASQAAKNKDYEAALLYYDKALELIDGKQNRQLEGQIKYYKGLAEWRRGDLKLAQAHLEESATVLSETSHDQLKSKVHGTLGQVYQADTATEQAIEHYKQKLLIDTKQGNETGQIDSLTSLGQLLYQTKDYPSAKAALNQALTLAQAYRHTQFLGDIYNHLGVLTQEEGDFKTAHGLFKQALHHSHKPVTKKQGYQNMAMLYLKRNKAEKALMALQKALEI